MTQLIPVLPTEALLPAGMKDTAGPTQGYMVMPRWPGWTHQCMPPPTHTPCTCMQTHTCTNMHVRMLTHSCTTSCTHTAKCCMLHSTAKSGDQPISLPLVTSYHFLRSVCEAGCGALCWPISWVFPSLIESLRDSSEISDYEQCFGKQTYVPNWGGWELPTLRLRGSVVQWLPSEHWSQPVWVLIPAFLLPSCVTSSKSLNFSVPEIFHP